jgi:hypothetical protein
LVTVPDTFEAAAARTLRSQLVVMERRDAEVMLAKLAGSPFAEGLAPEEILRRADQERWYAGRRIWYRLKDVPGARWMRGSCIDFRAPGMRIRVIPDGKNQRLRALDPDNLEIENRPERTQRIAREELERVQNEVRALGRKLEGVKKGGGKSRGRQQSAPNLTDMSKRFDRLNTRLQQCWDMCLQGAKELEHERSRTERLLKKRMEETV